MEEEEETNNRTNHGENNENSKNQTGSPTIPPGFVMDGNLHLIFVNYRGLPNNTVSISMIPGLTQFFLIVNLLDLTGFLSEIAFC